MKVTAAHSNNLKYLSLVTLTLQNAILGLSMRYGRTRPGDLFLSSTAVVMAEVVKLVTSLFLVYLEEGKHLGRLHTALYQTIVKQPLDTLKICVPSMLYIIQNNLLYVSASHLDAATYQVTYQLKILTTAVFAVIILRRRLLPTQWAALVFLVVGVASVQLAQTSEDGGTAATRQQSMPPGDGPTQNRLLGFSAALGACFLSGLAGIYFEKMLKGADISIWMRNIQLSLLSLPFGLLTCAVNDGAQLAAYGFFYGYDGFVVYLVILQAVGGLIVAVVVKYADNILKGFATSLAIIISCVASIYLFDFSLSLQFTVGAALVIGSIFLYGYDPASKSAKSILSGTRTTPKSLAEAEERLLAEKV
ncbi:UDP-N-acetylglucosamine transporter [Anopheles moucheti]|uniref:UDP-N-acetylglucosamine transporter n=1 Tax=Anopheles moucheti TaxID=186751 RepID=UPI0022F049A5|nr:UDP-N-acetylglucosamine transporter [Anopheles moucheti]XP_052900534.1 UDP-N-acetylglucosamine transporter [Anopheles moucheti]XP_052900535.1 UDP-N-acetylglucosamine transporter [Anopheles moucheti]